MLNLSRVLNQGRLLLATTGLNRQAFDALLLTFSQLYEQNRLDSKKQRQRALGAGRKAKLDSIEAKLFYILFYCKCYPTFDLASTLFDFDRSSAHYWVHYWLPILEQALGEKQALPVRKLRSVQEFCQRFPEIEAVIFDGTERPIQRPKDSEKQKSHYSGKKKRHTRKFITGSTHSKRVIILTKAREGKVHDKRQLKEENIVPHIPDEVAIEGDLGFNGLQNEYVNVKVPYQKPKGKKLTQQQKEENRQLSRQRVKCEHAHAGIKRYGAARDVYRNRVPNFDDRLMFNAAGLWNFYLEAA